MVAIFFVKSVLIRWIPLESDASIRAHWCVNNYLPQIFYVTSQMRERTDFHDLTLHDDNAQPDNSTGFLPRLRRFSTNRMKLSGLVDYIGLRPPAASAFQISSLEYRYRKSYFRRLSYKLQTIRIFRKTEFIYVN